MCTLRLQKIRCLDDIGKNSPKPRLFGVWTNSSVRSSILKFFPLHKQSLGARHNRLINKKKIHRVLVVATSCKTRGGITSVVKAHKQGEQWQRFHCHWVQTHRDGNVIRKLWYLAVGWCDYLLRICFYDLVHVHVSTQISAKRKEPFIYLAKLLHKKIIVHFHAFSAETSYNGKGKNLFRVIFHQADVLIVLSRAWESSIKEEFPDLQNIRVLFNPCTAKINKKKYDKKKQILYAGTVSERKGYADLIKAFAQIATKHPDWRVVLAGNGETDRGKAIAKSLGISRQVDFLGWVSGEEKDRAFKESMIFCLPSYAEGFPMAVLDAWSYGLPVISTPVGGLPDIARNGENMLLFMPGDINALAGQLQLMIENVDLRVSISKKSLSLAANEFNCQTIDKKLAEIYESVLQSR